MRGDRQHLIDGWRWTLGEGRILLFELMEASLQIVLFNWYAFIRVVIWIGGIVDGWTLGSCSSKIKMSGA